MTFIEKLAQAQTETESLVCVGLDPVFNKLPQHLQKQFDAPEAIYRFNAAIIEATQSVACAYKPNLAFYEALGSVGWDVLEKTLREIPPNRLVIADAKRGDIGNTARMYAEAFFVQLNCDAVTVAPYMGADSILPFLDFPEKAAFILGLTSNQGAADFEFLPIGGTMPPEPLYLQVAKKVAQWQKEVRGTAGLVVGATQPAYMQAIREAAPQIPFLVPGVGAQGGDASAAVQAGTALHSHVLINSSRQVLYASNQVDFAEAAYQETERLRQTLHQARIS